MTDRDLLALMPFADTLGLRLVSADAAGVRVRLDWDPSRCTAGGHLHGGAVMALADSAGGLCAYLNLPPDAAGTTTVESKTNFLRGVHAGWVQARSRPVHVGGTLIVVETDVHDDGGRHIARTTQSQLVLAAR